VCLFVSNLIDGLHLNDKANKELYKFVKQTIINELPSQWNPESIDMYQLAWYEVTDTINFRENKLLK
jgi:hypothetical protein